MSRGHRRWPRSSASSTSSRSCSGRPPRPAALAEIDLDQVGTHLGEDAARSLDRLAKLTKQLEDAGLIEQREGRFELTPKGMRRSASRRWPTCSAS